MVDFSKLRTRKEVAKALDKHVRSLERWHRRRIGPRRTVIGGSIYYHDDDLAAWLEECREDGLPQRRA